jgi:DNA-directed RNA polymerase specialized sigma24 family protein
MDAPNISSGLVTSTSPLADQHPSRRQTSAPDGAAAERQLARWIAEGDEAALGELIDLLGPTLYPLALGITQQPERAEQAIEESFAELWEKRAWLGRLPALSPWIAERCRAWAIALRTGAAPPPAPPLLNRAGDVPLTRRLLRCPPSVRTSRLSTALDQTGERERRALLAARAGVSPAAIAGQLGINVDEIPRLLRNGLHQMREALDRTLRREAL